MNRRMPHLGLLVLLGAITFFTRGARGDSLIDRSEWEKRVTVKTLPNGLTLVLLERHEAPIFSAFLRVGVGSVEETMGQTGLAHMFEHMAFKGTERIGTKDYVKEKLALAKVEKAYQAYHQECNREVSRDEAKVKELEEAWKKAIEEANQWVEVGEYDRIVSRAGGEGSNAFTNYTETGYTISFPSNQLELWAYLESERMRKPVMREFYQERKVVKEERSMRYDSSPSGRLREQFLATAFTAHPYGHPVVGWPSDLSSFSATDAQKFWESYYTPSNMVLTIVGDINTQEALPLLEAYFGRLPKRTKHESVITEEPKQRVERMIISREKAEPIYLEGYHRPNFHDKDDAVYDVLSEILDGGRTSRLYRALVRDLKLASGVGSSSCSPQDQYPCLVVVTAKPMTGHQAPEVREALHQQLNQLRTTLVSESELQAAKTRLQLSILRGLNDNMGLARLLGTIQQKYGDWRELFDELDRIAKVSSEDIKRVAQSTFVDENRTSAWIEKIAQPSHSAISQNAPKRGHR